MPPLNISKYVGNGFSRNNSYFLPVSANAAPNDNALYTCDNYPLKVLNNLNSLRQDTRFCDVEIITENRIFKVRLVFESNALFCRLYFTGTQGSSGS